jgi:hypothetical protein
MTPRLTEGHMEAHQSAYVRAMCKAYGLADRGKGPEAVQAMRDLQDTMDEDFGGVLSKQPECALEQCHQWLLWKSQAYAALADVEVCTGIPAAETAQTALVYSLQASSMANVVSQPMERVLMVQARCFTVVARALVTPPTRTIAHVVAGLTAMREATNIALTLVRERPEAVYPTWSMSSILVDLASLWIGANATAIAIMLCEMAIELDDRGHPLNRPIAYEKRSIAMLRMGLAKEARMSIETAVKMYMWLLGTKHAFTLRAIRLLNQLTVGKTSERAAEPAGAEPAGAEPAGAEPAGAEPAGAEPADDETPSPPPPCGDKN